MNPDVKSKWVSALRTGEVDGVKIHQVTDVLAMPARADGSVGMCCLGVLCYIAQVEGVDIAAENEGSFTNWYFGAEGEVVRHDSENLPVIVQDWAGIDSSNPVLSGTATSVWNDEACLPFDDIAEMIEKEL